MRTMTASRFLLLTFATLVGQAAVAQATSVVDQELIDRTVVRNRLYTVKGRLEVAPHVGFTMVNRLTDHWNFNLSVGWNMGETLALEVRGGYALSRHTGLARQVGEHLLQRNPNSEVQITSDLRNLWEMKANGLAGIRWAPLYGKISLMAELPVHFQAYLWAGGGGGTFHRESIVFCQGGVDRAAGTCANWFTEDKVTWIASGAAGLRFFTHPGGGLRVEVRNYVWPDSFLININRRQAELGQPTGEPERVPGLTQIVLLDLGYTFIF
jgi:outer membrane beta-barrel protein